MKTPRPILALQRSFAETLAHARQMRRSSRGVAAVEFALVLPVMVLMYLGLTEVTTGVNTDRKLTLLSRSLADLSSRETEVTTSDMSNVFAAAAAVMQPYDGSKVTMAVSEIKVTKDAAGNALGSVEWSCGKGPSAPTAQVRAVGSSYTVPVGFQTADYFILVETSFNYVPLFGGTLVGGSLRLGQSTPWPVRNPGPVTGPSPCP